MMVDGVHIPATSSHVGSVTKMACSNLHHMRRGHVEVWLVPSLTIDIRLLSKSGIFSKEVLSLGPFPIEGISTIKDHPR